jgi:uncharacterized protein (UPF0548 family)
LLDAARAAAPTYTVRDDSFRYDEYSGVVGRDWDGARDGLREWCAHAAADLAITPHDAPLRVGETVIGTGPVLGPVHVIIACRISNVLDEANRFGFTYVTLPGHPECGEETFMLSRADGEITFTMSAYSRPAELLAQLGGPVTRFMQRRANAAYIAGMKAYIAGG